MRPLKLYAGCRLTARTNLSRSAERVWAVSCPVEHGQGADAGARLVVLPAFSEKEVRRHLAWFAEREPDGLVFVGRRVHRSGVPPSAGNSGVPTRLWGYQMGSGSMTPRHTGHTL